MEQILEFFLVVHERSTRTAQGERGADAQRKAEFLSDLLALEVRTGDLARGGSHADLGHQLAELFAVFGDVDRIDVHADELYAVFFPHAFFLGFDGQVERRLTAHGGQYGVDFLFGEDLFDGFDRQGKQVYMVGRYRVGHDGGGVGVDQGDFDPFLAQRAGGLAARIVELGGLSDDDGAASDDQY